MSSINLRINHLETRLFKSYEPNKFVNGEFWTRCEAWLKNVPTDLEQQTLLRLLTQIFFVGPAEFEELFRCAYDGIVATWLADQENIDICGTDAQRLLREAAEKTWFCPVTDSFRINSFFHINNLPSNANLRPDWCSLHTFSDTDKLKRYITTNRIERLVLLEDFVGGGDQSLAAVNFAATHSGLSKILFLPMIICPEGAKRARELETKVNAKGQGSFCFSPVVELPKEAFFTPTESALPPTETQALRSLIINTYNAVSGGVSHDKPYHMYGFPPNNPTGGLVVMYTNTPDNTLPLIHWRPNSGTWEPVFPRHSRV